MGHIVIDQLYKEYIERRTRPRVDARNGPQRGDTLKTLEAIDLEIADGEMVCILGPSGCGKSTLLRIVAGFEGATSGRVEIDGAPVTGPSPNNIFVFQHSGLFPWMTVWENAGLGVRHLENDEERDEKIQEAIDLVELTGFEQAHPHQLSGGMQRRAELARALVVNPEILFMDEPFSGLDFLTRLKLREEIINMHEFLGKTIVFITHDIDEALVMSDHLVVFSERPARVRLDTLPPSPRFFPLNRVGRSAQERLPHFGSALCPLRIPSAPESGPGRSPGWCSSRSPTGCSTATIGPGTGW